MQQQRQVAVKPFHMPPSNDSNPHMLQREVQYGDRRTTTRGNEDHYMQHEVKSEPQYVGDLFGPDQSFKEGSSVRFRRRPLCASVCPADDHYLTDDVTTRCQELFDAGRVHFPSGIFDVIGDSFPGRKQVFKVWYKSNSNFSQNDETASFFVKQPELLVKATYGSHTDMEDCTRVLRELISSGKDSIEGGVDNFFGNPYPGTQKQLLLFYAADAGIEPKKMARLSDQFESWDSDGSGFLERDEALAAFFTLFPQLSPSQLQQKLIETDRNGDGLLSFDEFIRLAANM